MPLLQSIRERARVLRHLLTRRDWVTPVAHQVYHSTFGIELPDLTATLHPLAWWHDDRLPDSRLNRLAAHDFSRAHADVPRWDSEPEVSAFLAKWILLKGASNVLELGCFTGFTSAHLAAALSALDAPTTLTCVDGDSRYLDLARLNVAELVPGGTQPVWLHGLSHQPEILKQLTPPYDLIFLDTSHDELATIAEIRTYLPLLSPQGAFAFHDAIRWPGVRRAIQQAARDYPSLLFATSRGNGLALLLNTAHPTHHPPT